MRPAKRAAGLCPTGSAEPVHLKMAGILPTQLASDRHPRQMVSSSASAGKYLRAAIVSWHSSPCRNGISRSTDHSGAELFSKT